MKRFLTLATKVAFFVAGSAVIASAIVMNPAIAEDAHSLLKAFPDDFCTKTFACVAYTNKGSGAAIAGTGTSGIGILASSNTGQAVDARSNGAEGVVAVSQRSNAVRGTTTNPSVTRAPRSGVLGVDNSSDGGSGNFGVTGFSANGTGAAGTSTNGTGVVGTTSSHNAAGEAGVSGIDNSTQAVTNSGVFGSSIIGIGVRGISVRGTALYASNDSNDPNPVAQIVAGTSDPATNSLVTYDGGLSPTFWVDNGGNAHVRGLIFTGGPCNVGCLKTKGSPASQVQRYMPQESMPTIEDVGEAQLSGGSAYVRIDAAFANVMDSGAPYLVFVTPQGFTRGLYVANKTPQGFQVQEVPGGHGSVTFDYRIVAKPFGENARRLPMVSGANLPMASTLPRPTRPARIPTNIQQ